MNGNKCIIDDFCGFGKLIINSNKSNDCYCECDEFFTNDNFLFKFGDCRLTPNILNIFVIVQLVANFCALIFGIIKFKKTKNQTRKITIFSIIANFCLCIMYILSYINNFENKYYIWIFNDLFIFNLLTASVFIVQSSIVPVLAFNKNINIKVSKRLTTFLQLIIGYHAIVFIIDIIGITYADLTNDLYLFNQFILYNFVSIQFGMLLLPTSFIILSKFVIKELKELIANVTDNTTIKNSAKMSEYCERLEKIVFRLKILIPFVFLNYLILEIVLGIFKYLPYSYILGITLWGSTPIYTVMFYYFIFTNQKELDKKIIYHLEENYDKQNRRFIKSLKFKNIKSKKKDKINNASMVNNTEFSEVEISKSSTVLPNL